MQSRNLGLRAPNAGGSLDTSKKREREHGNEHDKQVGAYGNVLFSSQIVLFPFKGLFV